MKVLFVLLTLLSLNAFPIDTWTDGNGLSWTPLDVKTTYWRAKERCRKLDFDMPHLNDLLEALDYGLADATENTVFGEAMKPVDWMWTQDEFQVITSSFYIVSKWGDNTLDHGSERHWAICVKRPASHNNLPGIQ